LHGGQHFDDIGMAGRRTRQRRYEHAANGAPLPREALHSHIASIGVTRPIARPTNWQDRLHIQQTGDSDNRCTTLTRKGQPIN
jgi:hypothetical protein